MNKLLSLLVRQYEKANGRRPEKIVIHPAAMVVLAMRRSLGPVWNGIPVTCEAVKPKSLGGKPATALGLTLSDGAVRGFDI